MDERQLALSNWLQKRFATFALKPLAQDASFRRYFRLWTGGVTYVVMDAPPELESSFSFLAVAETFGALGLQVPTVLACDLQLGFLLLSDFGDDRYDRCLTAETAPGLYAQALEAIWVIQSCRGVIGWTLPVLDREFLAKELQDFCYWYLERHKHWPLTSAERSILSDAFELLVEVAARQKMVCIHRDFHSRNLMVYRGGVGILDFQNAMMGPLTYDCVSLLKDCYQTWPREKIEQWALSFRDGLPSFVSDEQFLRDFDFMGVQRHLKAMMTFSRKYHRDENPHYLPYLENTLQYVLEVTRRYRELKNFDLLLRQIDRQSVYERNDSSRWARHANGELPMSQTTDADSWKEAN